MMVDKYAEKKVLSVDDIKDILGIGYNSAYRLVQNSEAYNFPVHKIGRKIIIPKDEFFKAFNIH